MISLKSNFETVNFLVKIRFLSGLTSVHRSSSIAFCLYSPSLFFCADKRTKSSRLRILSGVRDDLLYNSNGPSPVEIVRGSEPVWNYTPPVGGTLHHHSLDPAKILRPMGLVLVAEIHLRKEELGKEFEIGQWARQNSKSRHPECTLGLVRQYC